jgi:outer membrane protein TolC
MYFKSIHIMNNIHSKFSMNRTVGTLTALILGVVIGISPIQAQNHLDTYIEIAAENNPQLRSSFLQYQAAMEKTNQVGLENLQFNLGVFLRPMERLMGNQTAEMSVMQMFPWFGMLKTQREESLSMAQAQYETFKDQRNTLVFEVKRTYFELCKLENEIEVTKANLEILKSLENLAIVRFQGGETAVALSAASSALKMPSANASSSSSGGSGMSMGQGGAGNSPSPSLGSNKGMGGGMSGGGTSGKLTDVLRLQVQIKALESQLEQLEEDKIPLQTAFNFLLNRPKDEEIIIEPKMPFAQKTLETLYALEENIADNPMIKMLEAESQAYLKQAEMAKLEGKPMIGAGVNYMLFNPRMEMGQIGMDYVPAGMGRNMVMPMINLSLPIHRKRFKALEKEAHLQREAVSFQKQQVHNELQQEFDNYMRLIKNSDRKVRLLHEQIQLTQQTLDLMLVAYATEGSSFEEILTVKRELLDYNLLLRNEIIEQHTNYAGLERITSY